MAEDKGTRASYSCGDGKSSCSKNKDRWRRDRWPVPEGGQALRSFKAQHRACVDIRVVKTFKTADGVFHGSQSRSEKDERSTSRNS